MSHWCSLTQEKVLLWLLQFMQEQAISLDEVDQNGNTAVHVAAQYGHLTCIQVRRPHATTNSSVCSQEFRLLTNVEKPNWDLFLWQQHLNCFSLSLVTLGSELTFVLLRL